MRQQELVWFVLSELPQTIGGRPWLAALCSDRHMSRHPPGGSLDMKQTRQGVPSWCHHHQTSPASSNVPSGWMWTDAWQPPWVFTSHTLVSRRNGKNNFQFFRFWNNGTLFSLPMMMIITVRLPLLPNVFPRCSWIGISLAKVVYFTCLWLYLLPPKTSWRPERPQSIILCLAQLWTCSQEWSSFTSPSPSTYPLHPHLSQTNPKKSTPPKFQRHGKVTYRRSKLERGSLFPAQKTL